jgi:flavin-binding protein dodecin
MNESTVYKTVELTGTSATTVEDAVNAALQRAHQTLKHLSWFQVIDTRGNIENGKVRHWQVTLKVGFALETAGT